MSYRRIEWVKPIERKMFRHKTSGEVRDSWFIPSNQRWNWYSIGTRVIPERHGVMDMGFMMGELISPKLHKKTVRFWWTEDGWKKFGRPILHYLISRGYEVLVLKKGKVRPGDVSYHDRYQVALLPERRK